jgi:Tfp pilus assembly protein PilE
MKVNESGRSMIEMLGVLAIIGVLSVGGIAGYSKAMSKYRVNKTIDQVSHIAANTRILFSSQKNYSKISNDVIVSAKLFPQEMVTSTTANNVTTHTFSNPFAGAVTMTPATRFADSATSDNKAFVIEYDGIPQEACIDIATIDWGTGSGGGLVALGVNKDITGNKSGCEGGAAKEVGNETANNAAVVCGGEAAMSVTNAVTACSKTDGNKLYFKFY